MSDINYLRLGNETYALSRIDVEDIDINEELREFYEARHNAFVRDTARTTAEEARDQWNRQMDHLRARSNRTDVVIPQELCNKAVMYWKRTLLELRVIMYSPTLATGYLHNFTVRGVSREVSEEYGIDADYRGLVEARLTPTVNVPVVVGYCKKTNMLYCPMNTTFHTHNNSSRSICTGEHTARDFWESRDFMTLMNHINLCSPASSILYTWENNRHVPQETVLNTVITDATITAMRRREDTVWTV